MFHKYIYLSWSLILCPNLSFQQPINGLLITARNVESLATFIDSTATIDDTSISFGLYNPIRFGPGGTFDDIILEVPIDSSSSYELISSSIRITVGFDNPGNGEDHDPNFGLTDGTNVNRFWIRDDISSVNNPSCSLRDAVEEGSLVSAGPVSHQVTFLFSPLTRFGACYTAQDGGYVNADLFNEQLVVSDGLTFRINCNNVEEEYRFFYFLIEILN